MDTNNLKSFDPRLDFPKKRIERRRKLLSWWVIGFLWVFLLFASLMPLALVMGLLKYTFQMSLLGLSTDQPISVIGLALFLLFSFKGVIAFALWTEKKWAVGLAKVDAIISIVVCFLVMAYSLFVLHSLSLRLELIVLFFYYYKMNQIQYDWENFGIPETIPEDTPAIL